MTDALIYRCNTISLSEILDFLTETDRLFDPAFSDSVNLDAYAHKLYAHSNTLSAHHRERLVGLLCFYANTGDGVSFIPYVCVLTEFQGGAVAERLFLFFEEKLKELGYTQAKLEVFKQNKRALRFYQKQGFRILEEQNDQRFLLIKEFR